MILIGFLGLIFISGCSTYYPSEIRVDNQANERVLVDISKNNTQVDITIQEKPRELIEYTFKGDNQIIQFYCIDDLHDNRILNHSILWNYQIEKVVRGNSVYSYPRIDVTPLQNILKINNSDYLDCHFKGMLEFQRVNYVDGILISNNIEFVRFNDLFGADEFRLNCVDYILKIQEECEVISISYELKQFIELPRSAVYYIFEYIAELR